MRSKRKKSTLLLGPYSEVLAPVNISLSLISAYINCLLTSIIRVYWEIIRGLHLREPFVSKLSKA